MEILMIFIGGLVLVALLFINFSSFFGISWSAEKYTRIKFMDNKREGLKFYKDLSEFVIMNDAGSHPAFADSDITYSEILEALNEKLMIVYSDSELQKLLGNKLNTRQKAEFMERMNQQQEAINELKQKLQCKNRFFDNRAIA